MHMQVYTALKHVLSVCLFFYGMIWIVEPILMQISLADITMLRSNLSHFNYKSTLSRRRSAQFKHLREYEQKRSRSVYLKFLNIRTVIWNSYVYTYVVLFSWFLLKTAALARSGFSSPGTCICARSPSYFHSHVNCSFSNLHPHIIKTYWNNATIIH